LFSDNAETTKGKGKERAGTSSQKGIKDEPISPSQRNRQRAESEESDVMPPPSTNKIASAKPKPGRLVSNQQPLEDFNRLIQGDGDVFRKAIQDLGAVVKENIEASFSRQAFPLALDCLQAMRNTALMYEEVETYNE
jgi:ATP-dependent DNA helicase 2 subunit 2